MLGNDDIPVKSKGGYMFDEVDQNIDGIPTKAIGNCVIIENDESVPLSRNERPLGGRGNYWVPPEETPNTLDYSYSVLNHSEEAPEEAGEEETGLLEKRIDSKIWKTRAKAYEELSNELKNNNSLFDTYSSQVLKFISDSHPGPQEKGLEILKVYIEKNPSFLLPHSENIVKALIEKGVSSTKSSIKQLSASLLIDFFSQHKDNFDGFIQGLLGSLQNKNLKVQGSAIMTINLMISSFGIKLIPYKSFIPHMEKLAGNSNPIVRSEAINFYKECYRWIRDLILPHVSKLKKAQQDELQKSFEEILEISTPTRYLKHEESKGIIEVSKPKSKNLDVYDIADAKDIFIKFNDKWIESVLDMDKWVDKKQALEILNSEANYPKIVEKSAAALVGMAKRLINDSNVNVMLQAMKLVGLLAKGQRKYFENYAKQFFPIFLSKLKDKKTQVIQETYATLENLLFSVNLEYLNDDIKEVLEDKTPTLKLNVTVWLENLLSNFPLDQLTKSIKNLAIMIKKNTDDSNAEVRTESFKLLSIMLKRFPETLNLALKDFPSAKMKKIEELSETTTVKDVAQSEETFAVENKELKVPTNENKEVRTPRSRSQTVVIKILDPGDKEKRLDLDSRYKWSIEEIRPDYLDKLKEQIKISFSADLYSLMFNPDFKKQADAAGHITSLVKTKKEEIIPYVDLLFKWCWIELVLTTNTQIYKAVLELDQLILSTLASSEYILNDTEAGLILPVLCEKSGQNNSVFRSMIRNILHMSCKVYPPEKVFSTVVQGINSKNARSKVECIEELGSLIVDYGIEIASPKDIKFITKQINSADANVRTASVDTMTEVYKAIGPKTWNLLGDVPDKVRGILDQRFRTVKVKFSEIKEEVPKTYEENKSKESFKNIPVGRNSEAQIIFNRINELNKPLELQKANERFQSLIEDARLKKPVIKDEDRLSSREKYPESYYNDKIDSKFIGERRDEFFKIDESDNLREETKQTKPIQAIRNAFKEKKLQKLKEASESSGLKQKIQEISVSEVFKALKKLESDDTSSKTEGLEQINDHILENFQKYEADLIKYSHEIYKNIINITKSILNSTEMSYEFVIYFFKVVQRLCNIEIIIKELKSDELIELSESFLQALVLEGLEKASEDRETDAIAKIINSSIVKVLELAVPDDMFSALLALLVKYKSQNGGKMSGILIKCLLRMARTLNSVINQVSIDKLLANMHLYLVANSSNTDEIGVKTMKTIVNELIKLLGDDIWNAYDKARPVINDQSGIQTWISIILGSEPPASQTSYLEELLSRLNTPELYPQALKDLSELIEKNPSKDLSPELSRLPPQISEKVTNDLLDLKKKKGESFSDPPSRLGSMKQKYNPEILGSSPDLSSKLNSIPSKTDTNIPPLKSRIQKFSKK
jgi:CLASP N terminal